MNLDAGFPPPTSPGRARQTVPPAGADAGRVLLLGWLILAGAAAAEADGAAVLSVSSRFGFGQACAIGPDLVLTAAHVLDIEPLEASVPVYPARFEAEDGTIGTLSPLIIDMASDLALARPSVPLTHFHPLAATAPFAGEELHWYGSSWNKRRDIATHQRREGKVLRVVSGQIWIEQQTVSGTSGSCVETARDEVVGIIWLGMKTADAKESTAAVAVFGPWRAEVERLRAKAEPAAEEPAK